MVKGGKVWHSEEGGTSNACRRKRRHDVDRCERRHEYEVRKIGGKEAWMGKRQHAQSSQGWETTREEKRMK